MIRKKSVNNLYRNENQTMCIKKSRKDGQMKKVVICFEPNR